MFDQNWAGKLIFSQVYLLQLQDPFFRWSHLVQSPLQCLWKKTVLPLCPTLRIYHQWVSLPFNCSVTQCHDILLQSFPGWLFSLFWMALQINVVVRRPSPSQTFYECTKQRGSHCCKDWQINLILYFLATVCEMTFPLISTHLRVSFKAFDERLHQMPFEKTKSVSTGSPLSTGWPALSKDLCVMSFPLQAPCFPIVAYMFMYLSMRFSAFFFHNVYHFALYGCHAAWSVVP